ncbi:MAG: hypothetical protein V3W18_12200 [candidate division Zixibacteria bacterium]
MKIPVFSIILFIFSGSIAFAQPGLFPELRSAIYRVEQPGLYEGTAIMFSEKPYNFLITNLHVVKNDSNEVCDSLFLYMNHIADNKEVISGPDHVTLYLRTPINTYYFEPYSGDVDLILISLGTNNMSEKPKGTKFNRIFTSKIPNSVQIASLVGSNSIFTAIGYPTKRIIPAQYPRYPEYRWGRIVGRDSIFLKMDIPILPGSSGSPIFVQDGQNYFFVGIVTLLVDGVCHALRASEIRNCFPRYFLYMNRH